MRKIFIATIIALFVMSEALSVTSAITFENKEQASYKSKALTPHAPIYISGDYNFTAENGVVGGAGTQGAPYIIEGWDIGAGTAYRIYIANTTAHFRLRNCKIHDSGKNYYGIYLSNVTNAVIQDIVTHDNFYGTCLTNSSNIQMNRVVSDDYEWGLGLIGSNNTEVTNSTFYNSEIGVLVEASSHNTFSNVSIYQTKGFGFLLSSSSDIQIANNNIHNSPQGLCVIGGSNISIKHSKIHDTGQGVKISYSSDITLTDCEIYNNSIDIFSFGVWLIGGGNNRITNCSVTYNYRGIIINSNNNTICYNKFVHNGPDAGPNAYDDGTNFWDDGSGRGNYWSDYAGADGNGDGIGDTPYNIPGGANKDSHPIMGLLTVHDPISIGSNEGFTFANGVLCGYGTPDSPYIIKGWEIDAKGGAGIAISNTNVYFILQYCKIYNGSSGVYIHRARNGIINNITCKDNEYGIYIRGGHTGEPLNIRIFNSSIYNNSGGIFVWISGEIIITASNIYNNSQGICFASAQNNQIIHCGVYNNSEHGIFLGDSANNNQITGNDIHNNSNGTFIDYSFYNLIYHNNFINNTCHAYESYVYYGNSWDSDSEGNYWDNHTGVDENGDGIYDNPFPIPGGTSADNYPLVYPYPTKRNAQVKNITLESTEQGIKISATVFNLGNTHLFNLSVSFLVNENIIASQEINLPVNSSQTVFTYWQATVGNHTIKVVLDLENKISEINEKDNEVAKLIQIADAVLTSESLSINISVIRGIDINITVFNPGPISLAPILTVYANNASIYTETVSLPPSGNTNISFLWNAPPGKYDIVVKADEDNLILEANENNNIITTTVYVLTGLPDLSVESILFDPSPLADGGQATAYATILNKGYSVSGEALVKIYDGVTLLINKSIPQLQPNEKYIVSADFVAHINTIIKVIIEPSGIDFDRASNEHTKIPEVVLRCDIVVAEIYTEPAPPPDNETCRLYAYIKNTGSIYSDTVNITFFDNEIAFYSTEIPSLSPGLGKTVWEYWTALDGHVIKVVATPTITDLNIGNNQLEKIIATLKTDLVVRNISTEPEPVIENETHELAAWLENIGEASTGEVTVSFYINDVFVGAELKAAILPDTLTTAKIPVVLREGDIIRVIAVTKCTDKNTTNNQLEKIITDALRPDLTVGEIVISPPQFMQNESVTIYATILNNGTGVARNILVCFYDNTTLINKTVIYAIEPGFFGYVSTNWSAQKDHTISVTVFCDTETATHNNQAAKLITEVYTPTPPPGGEPIIIAVGVCALLVVLYTALTETGKWKFLLLISPLYLKFKKEDVLSLEKRNSVYTFIQNNQGLHFSLIGKALNIGDGVLAYHLKLLEKNGKVRSENKRFHRYYWTTSYWEEKKLWDKEWIKKALTKIEGDICTIIKNNPGLAQRGIVEKIGKAQATISYHLAELEKKKIIHAEKIGREKRYYYFGKEM